MKVNKGLIVMCIGMLLLFSGCTSKKQENSKDLKMEDLTLHLNDKDFTLYQPISSVISDNGWLIDENDDKKIEALGNERVTLIFDNDDESYISVNVYNPKDEAIALKDALILGLNFSTDYVSSNIKCDLPSNLKFGENIDKAIEKYKSPYEIYSYDEGETALSYYSNVKMNRAESFTYEFKNGKLKSVSLRGSESKTKASENTTFDTKKVIGRDITNISTMKRSDSQVKAFDDLITNGFTVNGIVFKKDTPITAFTSQGYTVDTMDELDEMNGKTSLYLLKEGNEFFIRVMGSVVDLGNDENKILNADFDISRGHEIVLPNDINLSKFKDSDIIKLYGTPDEVGRSSDYENYTYMKDDVVIKFYIEKGNVVSFAYEKADIQSTDY